MSSPVSVDQSSIERMSDKDKLELRQFISNEQSRQKMQAQTHSLTDLCWKKCATGPVKGKTLDKTEEGCIVNCVDRFLDLSILTATHLASMRQQ